MKKLSLVCLLCIGACRTQLTKEEQIHMAGTLLQELNRKAEYTDSLKVEVFLMDETARDQLVKIPGGGFAFSKEYKEKVAGNKPLYNLVEQCNLNVLAYGTLKSYLAKELIRKVPGREGDSLQLIYNTLR